MSSAIAVEGARADAGALRKGLRRSERMHNLSALALLAPLLVLLLLIFALPIVALLQRSVEDEALRSALPDAARALAAWDGAGIPTDSLVAVFSADVAEAAAARTLGSVANRLNQDLPGYRSLLLKTGRAVAREPATTLAALVDIDGLWAKPEYWTALKRAAGPYTLFYLLAALDLREQPDGSIGRISDDRAIFVTVFIRTFWMSVVVTAISLVLAIPVAYLLSSLPTRTGMILLFLVLLPFWTSVLVRVTGWLVLLQREGLVNQALMWLRIVSEPLYLVHNRTGVYIGMVHLMLPYMILPIYAAMRRVDPATVNAALSLGAPPFTAFTRVFLPQCLPGISSGCVLVFILTTGYYTTPALIGGADDQMISYFIAFYTNETLNWGLASALSLTLLLFTLAACLLFYGALGRRALS